MKALSSLLLLALVTLAGCSADDLSGPDSATEAFAVSAHASASEAARPAPAATPFSVTGTWQASDEFGTVTLFLEERPAPPVLGPSDAPALFGGSGGVSTVSSRQIRAVTVEGEHKLGATIELALLDRVGDTLAKGQGSFSPERSAFKVGLTYSDGSERVLVFTRR